MTGFVKLLVRVFCSFAVIFIGGGILFLLFGDAFLRLVFGSAIAEYGFLMYAGLASSAFAACIAFVTDLLIAMRDMRGTLIANLAGCAISLPASVVLVDACGMNGVSYSIAFAYCVAVILSCWRIAHVFASCVNVRSMHKE